MQKKLGLGRVLSQRVIQGLGSYKGFISKLIIKKYILGIENGKHNQT